MAIAVVPDIALREPRLLIPGQPPMGPVVLRAEILQKVQYLVPVFGGNRPTYTLGTRDAVGIGWGTNQFSPAENGLYAGNASDYAYFDSAVNGRSINYCAWGFVALCLDPGTNNRFHTIQAGSSEHNCLDNGTTWTFAGESIAGPRASQLQGKIIAFGAIRTGSGSTGPTTVAANLGGEIITQYNAAGAFWSTSWAYDRYTLGNDGAFNDAAPAVHYYMFAHYSSNLFPEGEADLVRWVKDPFSWVEHAYMARTRTWLLGTASTGGATSITVTTPTVSITPTALTIQKNKSVSVTTAAVTITPTALTVVNTTNIEVSVTPVTVSITPTNLSINQIKVVSATTQTVSIAPTNLTIVKNKAVTVTTPSVTITPTNLTIDQQTTGVTNIIVSTPAVTIAKTDLSINQVRNVSVTTASITVTPTNLTIVKNKIVSVSTGLVEITPTDLTIVQAGPTTIIVTTPVITITPTNLTIVNEGLIWTTVVKPTSVWSDVATASSIWTEV